MKKIAIITARGGSKRIPKKNIKKFINKPIIAYSIEAAINSKVFDEVMVSTDSEEIAEIAKKYGATVPFLRSEETSNDYATTADVLKEVINRYKDSGKVFDVACCIYPTAPFITVLSSVMYSAWMMHLLHWVALPYTRLTITHSIMWVAAKPSIVFSTYAMPAIL